MAQTEKVDNIKDLIDYKPELMKVIRDEEVAKMIMDDLYFPILKVLRNGPMTVKEIEEEYNKIAKTPKSDKTIYRYLKNLQDVDLIRPAGQRVIMGKTATETLFSRTAYAFYLRNDQAEFWKTEEGRKLAEALVEALNPLVEGKSMNINKLLDFLENLSINRIDQLKEILENANDSLLEGISGYDWQRFTLFYNLGGLFALLLSDENLVSDLKDCFE